MLINLNIFNYLKILTIIFPIAFFAIKTEAQIFELISEEKLNHLKSNKMVSNWINSQNLNEINREKKCIVSFLLTNANFLDLEDLEKVLNIFSNDQKLAPNSYAKKLIKSNAFLYKIVGLHYLECFEGNNTEYLITYIEELIGKKNYLELIPFLISLSKKPNKKSLRIYKNILSHNDFNYSQKKGIIRLIGKLGYPEGFEIINEYYEKNIHLFNKSGDELIDFKIALAQIGTKKSRKKLLEFALNKKLEDGYRKAAIDLLILYGSTNENKILIIDTKNSKLKNYTIKLINKINQKEINSEDIKLYFNYIGIEYSFPIF